MNKKFFLPDLPIYKLGKGKKKVVIVAGMHGDETGAMYVAYKLLELASKDKNLDFNLTLMPILNFPGFMNKTREWYNGTNINREGKVIFDEATLVGQYFRPLTVEVKDADLYIDLHNFMKAINGCIQFVFADMPSAEFEEIKRFLSYVDFGYPQIMKNDREPHGPQTIDYAVMKTGVPTVIFEFSPFLSIESRTYEEYAQKIYSAIKKFFDPKRSRSKEKSVEFYEFTYKKFSDLPGIFILDKNIKIGDQIIKGQKIGEFINIISGKKAITKSTSTGLMQHVHYDGQVAPGDELYVLCQEDKHVETEKGVLNGGYRE